jgi:hypothetical protein
MAGRLARRGIMTELRDLSQDVNARAVRPKNFDLVMGKQ